MTEDTSKRNVGAMFDSIAHRYDFLNHLLSMGLDFYWRKKCVRTLGITPAKVILDVATGTCDLAISASRRKPKKIIGVDVSLNMLAIGRTKIAGASPVPPVSLVSSSAEKLPFRNDAFDGAMVAFGVRNFYDLEEGVRQIFRVLKPGARFSVLEFSKPAVFPVKQIYFFYFTRILPLIGRVFSKDQNAYTYLPESVIRFPEGPEFASVLSSAGFREVTAERITFGIVTLYTALK